MIIPKNSKLFVQMRGSTIFCFFLLWVNSTIVMKARSTIMQPTEKARNQKSRSLYCSSLSNICWDSGIVDSTLLLDVLLVTPVSFFVKNARFPKLEGILNGAAVVSDTMFNHFIQICSHLETTTFFLRHIMHWRKVKLSFDGDVDDIGTTVEI